MSPNFPRSHSLQETRGGSLSQERKGKGEALNHARYRGYPSLGRSGLGEATGLRYVCRLIAIMRLPDCDI